MPEENKHIIQTIKEYGKGLLGFIRRRVKNDAMPRTFCRMFGTS